VPVQSGRTGRESAGTERWASAGAERYTVEQLARRVGMSPRNIRAHQTRKLLAPPVREGRTAYYDASHRRRLEIIQSLQAKGFNLVAIEAMLRGSGTAVPDGLATALQRVGSDHPELVYALSLRGVVGRAEDGTVHPIHSRVLRSTLNLNRAGLPAAPSLQLLTEVLDSLRPVADELGQATSARILALSRRSGIPPDAVWEQLDRDAAFTQGLVDLLIAAFRAAVDNQRNAFVDLAVAAGAGRPLSGPDDAPPSRGNGIGSHRQARRAMTVTRPVRPGTASFR
jgi:DNA-binding transcriptional MerR regulator